MRIHFCIKLLGACYLIMMAVQLHAQTSVDFRQIDQWAISQQLKDTSIVDFTRKLTGPAKNDLEKMRAIFVFVTHYLKYDDQQSPFERKRINQNISDILIRKKGICWDYAQLINHMSDIAQIPCMTVVGFSQDLNNPRAISEQPDHAWNVVMLDEQYHLLDATWESNTLYVEDYLKQEFKIDYFLSDPRYFIRNHYPALDFYQLLSCPVDFQAFASGKDLTMPEASCDYNFTDSIQSFISLTYLDQKIMEASAAYHNRPNPKNESAWGHAIIDKAIDQKEKGDQFYEHGDYPLAKINYEEALVLFSNAKNKVTPFAWQAEALAFCHLNYAQILYRLNHGAGRSFKSVVDHLKESKTILEKLNSQSFSITSALDQINYQISVLE